MEIQCTEYNHQPCISIPIQTLVRRKTWILEMHMFYVWSHSPTFCQHFNRGYMIMINGGASQASTSLAN